MRTQAGLTQTELARRMGTTQSSIARIAHATLRIAAPGIPDIDLGGAA